MELKLSESGEKNPENPKKIFKKLFDKNLKFKSDCLTTLFLHRTNQIVIAFFCF